MCVSVYLGVSVDFCIGLHEYEGKRGKKSMNFFRFKNC